MDESFLKRMEDVLDRIRMYVDRADYDLKLARHERRLAFEALEIIISESSLDKRRASFERLKNLSEKEVGPWFWRMRKGANLEDELRSRILQLREMGYNLDWQWDLTLEALEDWTGDRDEDLLKNLFKEVNNASAK